MTTANQLILMLLIISKRISFSLELINYRINQVTVQFKQFLSSVVFIWALTKTTFQPVAQHIPIKATSQQHV